MDATATLKRAPRAPAVAQERPWPRPPAVWTVKDWLQLPDDGFRYEVIDGELYMTPLPAVQHQRCAFRLALKLGQYVASHNLGEVFIAPCGVELPGQPVPFEPDLFFVRSERLNIVGTQYVHGAPDLVVEVLSPSNWPYDRQEKFRVYRDAGVAEYWIVDYRALTVEVFVLEEGEYVLMDRYSPGRTVRSQVVEGFELLVDEVFTGISEVSL